MDRRAYERDIRKSRHVAIPRKGEPGEHDFYELDLGAEDTAPPRLPEGLRPGERDGECVNEKDGSVLVWVPPGGFLMGAGRRAAAPVHPVRVDDGFFMAKHEVTWGQSSSTREASRRRRRDP